MDGVTRAVVIGAGSIGLRHARVLGDLGAEVAMVSARDDLDLPVFGDIRAALAAVRPGYVVVANDTARHESAVRALAEAGFDGVVLVEKPFAVAPEATEKLPFRDLRVGYNLRFHPVTAALARALEQADVVAVQVYVGQHLSTWRPDREVASQYSAHAASGGGVLRDLSHELDYLGLLFGGCHRLAALGGRLADVTVDSDDAWAMLAAFERAPLVTVQLNYLAEPARRRVVVTTTHGLIEADYIAGELAVRGEVARFEVDRDATYRGMHEAMLAGGAGVASVTEALAVERLIAAIERSATGSHWEEP